MWFYSLDELLSRTIWLVNWNLPPTVFPSQLGSNPQSTSTSCKWVFTQFYKKVDFIKFFFTIIFIGYATCWRHYRSWHGDGRGFASSQLWNRWSLRSSFWLRTSTLFLEISLENKTIVCILEVQVINCRVFFVLSLFIFCSSPLGPIAEGQWGESLWLPRHRQPHSNMARLRKLLMSFLCCIFFVWLFWSPGGWCLRMNRKKKSTPSKIWVGAIVSLHGFSTWVLHVTHSYGLSFKHFYPLTLSIATLFTRTHRFMGYQTRY